VYIATSTSHATGVKHEDAIRGGGAVRQGHLAAIKEAVHTHAITDVILNFPTTASHLSRIYQALQPDVDSSKQGKPSIAVKDRTGVVLDIFRKHASSAEAHLQVRLAGLHPTRSSVSTSA
jgi:50S ribosomal subunit-associated GTPase HflX